MEQLRLEVPVDKSSLKIAGSDYNLKIVDSAPNSSIGVPGDTPGQFFMDMAYIYYCGQPYDGVTNIWKRIPWSSDTW
jgi:hypothetical protein